MSGNLSTAAPDRADMGAEGLSYARIAQSLARDYVYVFHVNLETEEYVRYVPHEEDRELVVGEHGSDFFNTMRAEYSVRLHPEDRDTFMAAVTKKNISHVLSVDRSFILNFRIMRNGKETYFEVKATRMSAADAENIVVGVTNVDAHMQRVAAYEQVRRDSHTFASILEAMASDYLSIFYVDFDTDEYVEYDPQKIYRGFGADDAGKDFFNIGWKSVLAQIHNEDQATVAKSFSKENLRHELSDHPTFIIICRMVADGRVSFVSIKATRMEGEDRHVVIGISDIDDQVRREEAHAQALGAAQAIANRDSLTGVKSKHAFTEAEASYNQMIKDGLVDEFAVVVCDVNGLKIVNDTQGHKAGDDLIRQACSLICKRFKHSPVYRVGGDEFVVILQGTDYENRQSLLRDINSQIDENKAHGNVVVAVGASDYAPDSDRGFLPVFDRADAAMYDRKTALKTAC